MHCWYARALLGLEIHISLDLIANVCIIMPEDMDTTIIVPKTYSQHPDLGPSLHLLSWEGALWVPLELELSQGLHMVLKLPGIIINTYASFGRFGRNPKFRWELRSTSNIVY